MATTEATEARFRELILYVADQCYGDERFGFTKLNKVLFNADFVHYGLTGESITGQEYQKLRHGPAPRRMLPALQTLKSEGGAVVRVDRRFGFPRKYVVPLREPDANMFTGLQIKLVDQWIRHFREMTAAGVSAESHEFIGWRLVDYGETIPYEAVFGWGTRPLTEREKKVGLEFARGRTAA
jgi:hypothetical protein